MIVFENKHQQNLYEWLFFDWHNSVTLSKKWKQQHGVKGSRSKTLPVVSNNFKALREKGYLDKKLVKTDAVKRKNKGVYQKKANMYRSNTKAFLDYCKDVYKWKPLPETRLFLEAIFNVFRQKEWSLEFEDNKHKRLIETRYIEEFRKEYPDKNIFEVMILFIVDRMIHSDYIGSLLSFDYQKKENKIRIQYLKRYYFDYEKLLKSIDGVNHGSDLWAFLQFSLRSHPEDLFMPCPEIVSDLINGCLQEHKLLFERTYFAVLKHHELDLKWQICDFTIDNATKEGIKKAKEFEKTFCSQNKNLLDVYNKIAPNKYHLLVDEWLGA